MPSHDPWILLLIFLVDYLSKRCMVYNHCLGPLVVFFRYVGPTLLPSR